MTKVNKLNATNTVKITGTNKVGQTLTASVSTNSNGTKSYQWWTATSATATSGANISGATGSTFKLTSSQQGKYVGCTVKIAAATNYNAHTGASDITDAGNNTNATTAAAKITPTLEATCKAKDVRVIYFDFKSNVAGTLKLEFGADVATANRGFQALKGTYDTSTGVRNQPLEQSHNVLANTYYVILIRRTYMPVTLVLTPNDTNAYDTARVEKQF